MRFSKEKVLKEIKELGNEDKITQEVIDDLDNFDGCNAVKSKWDELVYDTEVYVVKGKDGRTIKVERRFIEW